jgi:hypothetical protein
MHQFCLKPTCQQGMADLPDASRDLRKSHSTMPLPSRQQGFELAYSRLMAQRPYPNFRVRRNARRFKRLFGDMPMRKFILALIVNALAITSTAAPIDAFAAPPRAKGERCHFPNVEPGTWVGHFRGYDQDPFVSDGRDRYQSVIIWRCFTRKTDCDAWKYWVQTDYPAPPGTAWCRKK